jgi:hypothetical protein
VQDLDQTPASAELVRTLAFDGRFKIIPVDPTINAAQYARGMTLNLVLVIPSGYQRAFVQRLGLIGGVSTAAFRDADASVTVMTSSLTGAVSMNAELRQKGVIRKLSTLRIDAWLPTFILLEVFAFAGIGMILTRVAKEAESAMAAANAIMYPMMFLSGSFFPVEMMSGVLQKIARILPLYYANEGLRASMVFADTLIALRCSAVIGVFAAAVFVVGTMTTTWEEDK